ncbi:MAG: AbgT family transporter [Prevotella sp.]
MKTDRRLLPLVAIVLLAMQVVLVLASWIINVINPSADMRPLLSSEGIRWFVGSFTDILLAPALAWMLLIAIAAGSIGHSGLAKALSDRHRQRLSYRQRHALALSLGVLLIITAIIILLSFIPHAVLLGVSGSLIPSSFSSGLIPIIAFTATVVSISYGLTFGTISSVADIYDNLCHGLHYIVPLIPIYIFAMQLYRSLLFCL